MTITFLNENHEIKFHKIKYEERIGQSKLNFMIFCFYILYFLLFYYKPFKIITPLILTSFLAFILFFTKDIISEI